MTSRTQSFILGHLSVPVGCILWERGRLARIDESGRGAGTRDSDSGGMNFLITSLDTREPTSTLKRARRPRSLRRYARFSGDRSYLSISPVINRAAR